jgi:hypothetical protein
MYKFDKSSIIFIADMLDFSIFHINIRANQQEDRKSTLQNHFRKEFRFLIYVNEFVSLDKLMWEANKYNDRNQKKGGDLRHFEYFIFHNNSRATLAANLLFTGEHCNVPTQKVLNTFNKQSSEWDQPLVDFRHFDNFLGCKLMFDARFYNDEIMQHRAKITKQFMKEASKLAETNKDTNFEHYLAGNLSIKYENPTMVNRAERKSNFRGLLFEIVRMLSRRANFTPVYKFRPKEIGFGSVSRIDQKGIEITHDPVFEWSPNMSIKHHEVALFSYAELYFLITPNDKYTNFEKLFFAFDRTTWIMLGITFMSTFGGIFIINLTPRRVQRVFYGTGK